MGAQDPRRAAKFLSQRACELVGRDSDVGRRARILNVRGAVSEAAGLSRAFAEAGGVTQPNEEPSRAGHGIATLPDVIDEAQRLLSEDVVLRERAPALREHVRDALDKVRGAALQQPKPNVRDAHVRALETARDELESSYLGHTLDAVTHLTLQRPDALLELESAVQSLVTDLRARGWSDPKLTTAFKLLDSDAPADALATARNQFQSAIRTFTCYVPVSSLRGCPDRC